MNFTVNQQIVVPIASYGFHDITHARTQPSTCMKLADENWQPRVWSAGIHRLGSRGATVFGVFMKRWPRRPHQKFKRARECAGVRKTQPERGERGMEECWRGERRLLSLKPRASHRSHLTCSGTLSDAPFLLSPVALMPPWHQLMWINFLSVWELWLFEALFEVVPHPGRPGRSALPSGGD